MNKDQELIESFMYGIRTNIAYWINEKADNKYEMMEGLAFSILLMLDGSAGYFNGDIDKLAKASKNVMLHDCFYAKYTDEEDQ